MRLNTKEAIDQLVSQGDLAVDSRVQDGEDLKERLRKTGCILDGHFELQSGEHSQYFLRALDLLSDPKQCTTISRLLLEAAPETWRRQQPLVVTPESSGARLGEELARQLNSRALVARVDLDRRPLSDLRRGGPVDSGTPVIVANDVCSTGGSLDGLLQLVGDLKLELLGVVHVAVRDQTAMTRKLTRLSPPDLVWLLDVRWRRWQSHECPLCERRDAPRLMRAAELN